MHCPKNDQNLSLKTELVRVGADVRVARYAERLGQIYRNKSQTYTVASAPAVTESVGFFLCGDSDYFETVWLRVRKDDILLLTISYGTVYPFTGPLFLPYIVLFLFCEG